MTEFSDTDLIEFVLGNPTPHSHAIAEAQRTNEELAAKLFWMRGMAGIAHPQLNASVGSKRPAFTTPNVVRFVRDLLTEHRRAAAMIAGVLLLAGFGWAGAVLLTPPPLLEDSFTRPWLDPSKWKTARAIVKPEKGFLTLINRGCIVSQEVYAPPISISFEWLWKQYANPDPMYNEHLSVVLRTSGKLSDKRPFEVVDGLLVKFNAWSQNVSFVEFKDDTVDKMTPLGSLPLIPDQWHQIRIDDDGKVVSVYLTGPEIHNADPKKPVIQLEYPDTSPDHRIAIYNREHIADIPHTSQIRNFVLRKLGTANE